MVDYIITVTYGAGGKVSPEGAVKVKEGADLKLKIEPTNGYTVGTVLVDGNPDKLTGDAYLFSNVIHDHTFDLKFIASIDGSKPVKAGNLVTSKEPTITDLNVIVTPKSKVTGGFAICPHCGSTFGNIIYVKERDHIKCLMCNWESEVTGENKDPLKEIQDSLLLAKPIKPEAIKP